MKLLHLCLASLLIAGCDEKANQNTNAKSLPSAATVEAKVDTSSPDNAVKSWWALRDQEAKAKEAFCKSDGLAELWKYNDKLASIATDAAKATISDRGDCTQPTFVREIREVKVESDTRAIVYATVHNSTPIPPTAEASEYAVKARAKGEEFKYLTEKVNGRWLVSQLYEHNDYPSETAPEWRPIFTTSRVPSYPSYVPWTSN